MTHPLKRCLAYVTIFLFYCTVCLEIDDSISVCCRYHQRRTVTYLHILHRRLLLLQYVYGSAARPIPPSVLHTNRAAIPTRTAALPFPCHHHFTAQNPSRHSSGAIKFRTEICSQWHTQGLYPGLPLTPPRGLHNPPSPSL